MHFTWADLDLVLLLYSTSGQQVGQVGTVNVFKIMSFSLAALVRCLTTSWVKVSFCVIGLSFLSCLFGQF